MAAKAATEAVETAVAVVARRPPFAMGRKKLFLPNHVVTFVRPKPGQSPTTATFKVPLTFNKFDFRDYLYNVYDVEVSSVRSFINQMRPQRRALPGGQSGRWYRPRSQKMMVVDLKKPFVWPERPSEADMEPWDHNLFAAVEDGHDKEVSVAQAAARGTPKLRTEGETDLDRVKLRNAAQELLSGKRRWVPGTQRVEVEKEKEQTQAAAGEATEEVEEKGVVEAVTAAEAKEAKEGEEKRL